MYSAVDYYAEMGQISKDVSRIVTHTQQLANDGVTRPATSRVFPYRVFPLLKYLICYNIPSVNYLWHSFNQVLMAINKRRPCTHTHNHCTHLHSFNILLIKTLPLSGSCHSVLHNDCGWMWHVEID